LRYTSRILYWDSEVSKATMDPGDKERHTVHWWENLLENDRGKATKLITLLFSSLSYEVSHLPLVLLLSMDLARNFSHCTGMCSDILSVSLCVYGLCLYGN